MDVLPGDSFDRYTIEALIGEGGMGRVYRARDERLRRRVALKLLRRDPRDGSPTAVARVLYEARAAAALDHPGSVAIFDVGEVGGVPFIAMEYVVGRSLRDHVGDERVAPGERLRWLREVARVLAVAHAAGLVHRDIKPENVMVRSDGAVKVLDFGIARLLADEPDPHEAGSYDGDGRTFEESELCGTPAYMAPEQVQGRQIDARADQFAWGVLAYELLSGALPWHSRDDGVTTRVAVVTERQARLSPPAGLPPQVAAVVDRALEKDPARRFATMTDLLAALEPTRRSVRAPAGPTADWTLFVGREPELAALLAALVAGKRMVTLLGPPGVGKTRLARVAAGRGLAARFPGRVWFVDAAEATSLADLVHAATRALGVSLSLEVGPEASLDPLAATLVGLGRAALVFDGVDRLAGRHAAALGRLLERAPELCVVATSRGRLGVRGEQVIELGPLTLPADGAAGPALADADAVRLFVDRVQAVRPGYRVDDAELTTIAALVRRLDGLPQAIELAAARMTVLDARGLLDRLDRDAAGRDAAGVEAAVAASWAPLDADERAALARCSLFRGGFDLDAAEAVLGDDAGDVADVLGRLRGRSLLAAREPDDAGKLQFFLYRSIREFAAAQLAGDPLRAASLRHARWYATRAAVLADAVRETGGAAALAALAALRDNLRAIPGRLDPTADGELLALALLALDPLELAEGGLAGHLAALERALAGAVDPSDRRVRLIVARARALHALGRASEAIAALAVAGPDAEARLVAAGAHASIGAREPARRHADEARTLALQAGRTRLAAHAELLLAALERDAGRLTEATSLLRDARARLHAVGARVDEGRAALALALARAAAGACDEAMRLVTDATGLLVGAADPRLHAAARAAAAGLALAVGRDAEARAAAEEALARQRQIADVAGEATSLAHLAGVHLDEDDAESAASVAAAALALGHDQPRLRWLLAVAAWDRGLADDAAGHAQQATLDAHALGDRPATGVHAATLAAIEASRGRGSDAAEALAQARSAHAGLDGAIDLAAADLAAGFDELRQARELAARGQRQAADLLSRARARLAAVLAPPAMVDRSFVVRALARRLHRAMTPTDRRLAWAEALDPDRRALILDRTTRSARLPATDAWLDGPQYRRIAALVDHREDLDPQGAADALDPALIVLVVPRAL